MASLNSARRHASISGVPHSRKTSTGEAPPNQDGSSTPPPPPENSDNEEVLQQPHPGQPPHSYVHGHLPGVPWSAELDAIKAPELLESHPEALFTFKLAYERYCKQLFDVSERHNTTIPPKPVIDCVEEYTLLYICTLSDILEEGQRGQPEDVDPVVFHAAIMGVRPEDLGNRIDEVLHEIKQIKIHIDGTNGQASITKAWKRLIYLEKHYQADVVPKIVVSALVANVTPAGVRESIKKAQKGGSELEQRSYTNVLALHEVLVGRAKVSRLAAQMGLFQPNGAKPRTTASGLVARPANPPKSSGEAANARRHEMSEACKRLGPCSAHGPKSVHSLVE